MFYERPDGVLAGFHANRPDKELPELIHVGEHWASTNHFISQHTHAIWEFYFQVNGECRWDYANTIYTLLPGSFFAVAPYILHTMYEPPQEKHHYLYAAIDLALVFERLPKIQRDWEQKQVYFIPQGERLQPAFRQLIREVSSNNPYRALGMRTALDYLIVEASRLLVKQAWREDNALIRMHPAVLRAKELLDYQPGARWQLADIARMVDLSANHLVECFTRDVGVSPRQYLLQVRIERAKELLLQSDLEITNIAFELGFSSSQHFASIFKRSTGETAQDYRQKQLRKEK